VVAYDELLSRRHTTTNQCTETATQVAAKAKHHKGNVS
jgi:hypothetical protein